ncbi:hypothetical protein Tco_1398916, partial [Tanacetum coccineum]
MRLGFIVVCAKVTPRQKRDGVKPRYVRSGMGIRVLKGVGDWEYGGGSGGGTTERGGVVVG